MGLGMWVERRVRKLHREEKNQTKTSNRREGVSPFSPMCTYLPMYVPTQTETITWPWIDGQLLV